MNVDLTDDDDPGSTTLIRRGTSAVSFAEMASFAKLMSERPMDKLLSELPALAGLSHSKFMLSVQVLRTRFRKESEADRQQLIVFGNEIADSVPDPEVGARIRSIFDQPA